MPGHALDPRRAPRRRRSAVALAAELAAIDAAANVGHGRQWHQDRPPPRWLGGEARYSAVGVFRVAAGAYDAYRARP